MAAATKVYLAVGVASGRQSFVIISYRFGRFTGFRRQDPGTVVLREGREGPGDDRSIHGVYSCPCLGPQELLGYADMPGLGQLLCIN